MLPVKPFLRSALLWIAFTVLAHASGGGSGGGSPPPPPSCPTVSFSFATQGLMLSLATTSTAGSDPIIAYTWTFGDGATGTGMKATHGYAKAGTYSVKHTVRDVNGFVETVGQLIKVTKKGTTTGATALGYHDPMHLHAEGTVAAASVPSYLWLIFQGEFFSTASALFRWQVRDTNTLPYCEPARWRETIPPYTIVFISPTTGQTLRTEPFPGADNRDIGPLSSSQFDDRVGFSEESLVTFRNVLIGQDFRVLHNFQKKHFINPDAGGHYDVGTKIQSVCQSATRLPSGSITLRLCGANTTP